MPVRRGRDSQGPFYQWGSQKKYHYDPSNPSSRERAKKAAQRQGAAVRASQGRSGNPGNSHNKGTRKNWDY